MAEHPPLKPEKPKRRRGRPTKLEELKEAMAALLVDPQNVDPLAALAGIMLDPAQPGLARVQAARLLLGAREQAAAAKPAPNCRPSPSRRTSPGRRWQRRVRRPRRGGIASGATTCCGRISSCRSRSPCPAARMICSIVNDLALDQVRANEPSRQGLERYALTKSPPRRDLARRIGPVRNLGQRSIPRSIRVRTPSK
jgi:hypothetical protein